MLLVKQLNHATCQQACIAMLAGKSIESVIEYIGDKALSVTERRNCFDIYGIKYPTDERALLVTASKPFTALMNDHKTMWLHIADYKDSSYAHAVMVHEKHMYDPWRGLDPIDWPWTRYIWTAMPILAAPAI